MTSNASVRPKHEVPGADRLYWAAIRTDLIRTSNREALGSLRTMLGSNISAERRPLASLSSVRLLDMLAWQHATAGLAKD